MLISDVCWLFE